MGCRVRLCPCLCLCPCPCLCLCPCPCPCLCLCLWRVRVRFVSLCHLCRTERFGRLYYLRCLCLLLYLGRVCWLRRLYRL